MGVKNSSRYALDNRSYIGTPTMTSKPRFIKYSEQVQKSLSLFSLTDARAGEYMRGGHLSDEDRPKFLLFEMLLNDPDQTSNQVRVFEPFVYDPLLEGYSGQSYIDDLKRLYDNAENLKIDWQSVDWESRDHEFEESSGLRSNDLKQDMRKLDDYHSRFCVNDEAPLTEDIKIIQIILKKLVKRYEFEYIPVSFAASALIYEAWLLGELSLLGEFRDGKSLDNLINALFIHASKKPDPSPTEKESLLLSIARNLGLNHIEKIGDKLSTGEKWTKTFQSWFACVEQSLIHKVSSLEDLSSSYLIHFPLVIDNFWFAGFCYMYTAWNKADSEEIPEIFIKEKYLKIYATVQSVSETLKISLRADALTKAQDLLLKNRKSGPNEIFADVLRDYFVCFDVVRVTEDSSPQTISPINQINSKQLYSGHGVCIYGPEWITEEHQSLIEKEIDGDTEALKYYKGTGLYEEIAHLIEQDKAIESEGRRQQAALVAHQAAGLISEVWLDPARDHLNLQAKYCLWHLKSLINISGNFDLGANQSICDGKGADFREWEFNTNEEILSYLVDIGFIHALRRATYKRAEETAETENLDRTMRDQAEEIINSGNFIAKAKDSLQWRLPEDSESSYPDWFRSTGFVLCFHHCFWQAAYHAFRAMCDQKTAPYLWIELDNNKVSIFNRAEFQDEDKELRTRDRDFYDLLQKRINNFLEIDGPEQNKENEYWKVSIIFNENK